MHNRKGTSEKQFQHANPGSSGTSLKPRTGKSIPYPPVSKQDAMRIALANLDPKVRDLPMTCHGIRPTNCSPYLTRVPSEPCWYIYAPWDDERKVLALRSSRLILIGKITGTTYYDGTAGDEG